MPTDHRVDAPEFEMPNDAEISRLAQCFTLLGGDPTRGKLFQALSKSAEPKTVIELQEVTHMSQPGVSHHLSILRKGNYAAFQHAGRHHRYYATSEGKSAYREAIRIVGLFAGITLQEDVLDALLDAGNNKDVVTNEPAEQFFQQVLGRLADEELKLEWQSKWPNNRDTVVNLLNTCSVDVLVEHTCRRFERERGATILPAQE